MCVYTNNVSYVSGLKNAFRMVVEQARRDHGTAGDGAQHNNNSNNTSSSSITASNAPSSKYTEAPEPVVRYSLGTFFNCLLCVIMHSTFSTPDMQLHLLKINFSY